MSENIVPGKITPRNIVICCDGTGNQYGPNNTNVVKLYEAIEKDATQIAFYDPGVGTFGSKAVFTKPGRKFTRFLGLMVGFGITRNIEDGYEFLMNTYREGDRIYLFGFSRGAYTARALAGMVYKCGLLRKGNKNLIPYASKMYHNDNEKVVEGFKKAFSRECKIHFVGVWDTVKSVGLLLPRKFPNAKLNPDVKNGYHALAIDEKRSKFPPNLWDSLPDHSQQTIEQVWFAGVHSDVGGWYKEAGLSNICLKWMIEKAGACDLKIDPGAYPKPGHTPDHTDKKHKSFRGFWLILFSRIREIKEGSVIHRSAINRIRDVKEYKPTNLPKNYTIAD